MKRLLSGLLAVLLALFVSGCDFDVYELPLPGGADTGEDPIRVQVEFADVLDLVPHSTVKVNDVTVGKVTDISLDDYHAVVDLELRRDVELPANAVAELRQTSLLGEKFVSLAAPADGAATGRLGDGDRIPLDRSGRNPEVEEVLGALSLVLNGGGVAQLNTITKELNRALEGREDSARSVLRQLRVFMGELDDNKGEIIDAIEALNRLAISAEKQLPTIDAALDELPSALESIDRQRDDLVEMLAALDRLSSVAVDVISRSKGATITALQRLDPVLTQLAAAGDDFTNAFHVFLTYPFVDETVGRDPQVARNLHMGDFTNLSITLDLELPKLPTLPTTLPTLPTNLPSVINPTVIVDNVLACLRSGSLTSEACKRVLATPAELLKLREECQKPENRTKDVCKELNALPVPGLPSLSPPAPVPTATPTLPVPTTGLPTLGLPRAAAGERRRTSGGVRVADLVRHYDPDLVALLLPGMVIR